MNEASRTTAKRSMKGFNLGKPRRLALLQASLVYCILTTLSPAQGAVPVDSVFIMAIDMPLTAC
jgi:hypothetical protein